MLRLAAIVGAMHLILDEPLLDADAEVELARAIEAGVLAATLLAQGRSLHGASPGELAAIAEGGRAARDRFVRANLRLVVREARGEARRAGLPEDELFQEGAAGLLMAVDRFDHARGLRFATYALPWIRSHIGKAVVRRCGALHLPTSGAEARRVVRSTAARLRAELGREATVQEVAREVRRPSATVAALLAHDAPASLTGVDGAMLERACPAAAADFEAVESGLAAAAVAWDDLPALEREVVALRFGLRDGRPRTYAEAAARLGVSASSVRRREAAALRRLRAAQEAPTEAVPERRPRTPLAA